MIKNLKLLALLGAAIVTFSACEALQDEAAVKSETITEINGRSFVYELFKTGPDKYRYEFNLIGPADTTQIMTADLHASDGNEPTMEIEQGRNSIKVLVDKPIGTGSKTIDGFTFEIVGSK